jgi:hypothetical protein
MTSRYGDARALRRALEDRLRDQAAETSTDLARRRRLVVFDRIATRLASDSTTRWILKGGAAMEFRLERKARTTKDLDIAAEQQSPSALGGSEVRELLIDTLATDHDGDGFTFRVSSPTELKPDSGGRGGWRYSVDARLAGKTFAGVRIDVVARSEEIMHTERLPLPNTLAFAGTPPRSILAVDRRQHFAEKLHAFTRQYGDRPNTRVKDLVDLVLLIETGLAPDSSLVGAVDHVFSVRATHAVPVEIPEPPPAWTETYPTTAAGLTETEPRLDAALALVRAFWSDAHRSDDPTGGH